ncbi:MAG: response regulator [Planctomycetes bacterium]|nr:response regulator [Planctomycetota bacterium]
MEHQGEPLLLVVEDDAGVAAALVLYLHEAGLRCVLEPTAHDAAEALRDLSFLDVPLAGLLTDFDLPDGTGCEVVHAFRARHPELPVALMSGSADVVRTEWMQAQDVDLLPKPFTKDELSSWLTRLLDAATVKPTAAQIA